MKFQISQLKEGENPFQYDSLQDGWVKDIIHHVGKQGYELVSSLKVEINITKLEPDYYLRGSLTFSARQTCARCAEPFSLPITHVFNLALAHVSQTNVKSAELLAEESEELDVAFFDGTEIDLGPIIEEQFFLSLPYQAVCREGCAGICQNCGKNLNEGPCKCEHVRAASPFAALQGLKLH